MTIIDRYIARMFIGYFVAGLLVFCTIFIAVDAMSFMARHDASLNVLVKYYGLQVPITIYQMLPVSSLLATVFTLSNLNKSSELVALFSVGMSLARVSAPILVVVSIVSALAYWMSDRILPRVTQKKNYVYYVDIRNKPNLYSTVKTDKIWYRSENILFNIKTLNPEEKRAQGLTLYYFDPEWNLIQLLTADKVNMSNSDWVLEKGNVTLFTADSSFPLSKAYQKKIISMNEQIGDLQHSSKSMDTLNVSQLKKFISKNKESGLDTLHYEVDYQSKYSYAFAAFVMSLMGIPFSVKRQRSGGMIFNAGACLVLSFLYWAFYSSALTMGKHGSLPPVLAAWLPNGLFVGGSIYLLTKLKK